MALARCSGCQMRAQPKFSSIYAAYFTETGERVAYKARLCNGCLREHVAPYIFELDPEEPLRCPSCGIGTENDYVAVYGKAFIVGTESFDFEIPFCAACQLVFRQWFVEHAEALEDRRRADDSPTTHPSGLEVLRSLGVEPRVR